VQLGPTGGAGVRVWGVESFFFLVIHGAVSRRWTPRRRATRWARVVWARRGCARPRHAAAPRTTRTCDRRRPPQRPTAVGSNSDRRCGPLR